MQEQDMEQPGKSPDRNDREHQDEMGTADPAVSEPKTVRPGGGDPQTNADGSPANGGIDPKRGF